MLLKAKPFRVKRVSDMTDQSIIDLFWRRSEDAVRNTADKYGSYLIKIAMNILGRYEESEECVNDTYFTAWKQIPPDRPSRLLPYLGRITRCLALNRYDYNRAQKRDTAFTCQLSELEECLSGSASAEQEYESGEIAACISAFLTEQSEDARNIFIRRYWYSDSIADIAERFKMGESKVKSMLLRTRKKLRIYLESEGYYI